MARLQGKVALVTGGAMGIGRATAMMFAAEGAKVVLGDVNEIEGAKVVEEILRAGGAATFMKLDVSSEDDWRRVVAETVKLYGKLTVLVNNAGISLGHDI